MSRAGSPLLSVDDDDPPTGDHTSDDVPPTASDVTGRTATGGVGP